MNLIRTGFTGLCVIYILCRAFPALAAGITIAFPGTRPEIVLDQEQIAQLPHTIIRTTTPWTKGVTEFEGVLLRDLLGDDRHHDIDVIAMNAYTARIPVSDINQIDVILAYKVNGAYPSIRQKGPYWVIYPRDNLPEMSEQDLNMRMVWQVQRIRVAPDAE